MDETATATMTANPTTVGTLYTTAEVAHLLRVNQRTVQVWIHQGLLRAVRYGRLIRVRQADLEAFGEVLTGPAASTATAQTPA